MNERNQFSEWEYLPSSLQGWRYWEVPLFTFHLYSDSMDLEGYIFPNITQSISLNATAYTEKCLQEIQQPHKCGTSAVFNRYPWMVPPQPPATPTGVPLTNANPASSQSA